MVPPVSTGVAVTFVGPAVRFCVFTVLVKLPVLRTGALNPLGDLMPEPPENDPDDLNPPELKPDDRKLLPELKLEEERIPPLLNPPLAANTGDAWSMKASDSATIAGASL